MIPQRSRIRFSKQAALRFIGHRDLARSMERLFRRAGLRLQMSQGFHPKPRLSFPSALALGIEGHREIVELELAEPLGPDELVRRLNACTIAGLRFQSAEILPAGAAKAQLRTATYEVLVPQKRREAAVEAIRRLMAQPSCLVQRPDGRPAVDVRASLEALELAGETLRFRLLVKPQRSAGPRDVLAALGLGDLEQQGCVLVRTDLELNPQAR